MIIIRIFSDKNFQLEFVTAVSGSATVRVVPLDIDGPSFLMIRLPGRSYPYQWIIPFKESVSSTLWKYESELSFLISSYASFANGPHHMFCENTFSLN